MNKLTGWIKHHPVATFLILAYLITWPLLLLVYHVFPDIQTVIALSIMPAVFSPALAAMLISSIVEPQPKARSRKPRWVAFGITWLISWALVTLYCWQVEMLKLVVAAILGTFFALFPAWILSSAFARTPGIRKHFSTLIRPKGNLLWYLVAFFTVPALALLGAEITRLLGGEVYFRLQGMSLGQMVVFFALTFFYGFLYTGGINEESGWRGFALPRLQARYPVIVSVAIVWFFLGPLAHSPRSWPGCRPELDAGEPDPV